MTIPNHDAAHFRIRDAVPAFDAYVERYRELSRVTRESLHAVLDCVYGPSALERLDVFVPPSAELRPCPVHVFFHGGYWRAFDKSDYSYIAEPVVAHEAIAVIVNYGLMPGISMSELVAQCRSAIRWLFAHIASFGGDPNRLSVSGHSAGAHIASLLWLTRWQDCRLPSDAIKSAMGVSGIYDLNPVLHSFLQSETGMTPEEAQRFSPIHSAMGQIMAPTPLVLAVGADETSEFRRQTLDFADALRSRGATVAVRVINDRHHMNIVLDLGDAQSELGHLLLDSISSVKSDLRVEGSGRSPAKSPRRP